MPETGPQTSTSRLKQGLKRLARLTVDKPIEENWREFMAERRPLIWLVALVIGVSAAYGVILFRLGIAAVQWLWLGAFEQHTATIASALPWWQILLGPIGAGLVVGLALKYLMPGGRIQTVADVIEAENMRGARMSLSTGLWSAGLTAISLGGGASAGREGPAVHLGATLASTIAKRLRFPPDWSRVLLACGAAAAVSASFNAPIAGVLFAHEVILAHYALRAFVPITIASVAATLITRIHLGDFPAFSVPMQMIVSYWEFPAFALLGVVSAVVAIAFMSSAFKAERLAQRLPLPLWLRPAAGGVLVGLIALGFPQVLGVGYEATDQALKGVYPLALLLALIVAKIIATAITLASRCGGGVFSPSLYLGAMAGSAFGIIAASFFPDVASSPGVYAIIGMGAVAAAVLGAPISTTLIVFELVGDYNVTIALLLANSISTALTQAVIGKSFFHWQLESRNLLLHEGPHRRILMTQRVRDVMDWYDTPQPLEQAETPPGPGDPDHDQKDPRAETPALPALAPSDNLSKALGLMTSHKLDVYPVINPDDPGLAVGEISQLKALKLFNEALIAASREEHR